MKTAFHVTGTHCPSCKALIEDICNEQDGVRSCTADYKTGRVIVEHEGKLDKAAIKKEIESLGNYKVQW